MFFGFIAQFWWLGKTKRFMSKAKADKKYKAIYLSQANKFSIVAVEMGGLIIKLGQFISSRVDILPKEYTDTLSTLQDSVAPECSEVIIKRIESEHSSLKVDTLDSFEPTPIAAASLGQVHRAHLPDGTMVAVKVMRPGIEDIVALDLKTLKILTVFARKFTKVGNYVDLNDVYDEFDEVINEELDYLKEAKNIEKFGDSFSEFPGVSVPKVYWDYTTNKVLVMEYITGVKINETHKLTSNKVKNKKLAQILFMSYLKQLLEDGFFHADPHPGNILVKEDGTIVFIDFGMVGTVSTAMRENMFQLAMSVYLKDAGGLVEAFNKLGFLRKHADKSALTKNVKVILENLTDEGFNFNNLDKEEFLLEMREFLYQMPFQIPSQTTFLGKAIITVFSICNGLDKNFDFVGIAKPFVKDMMDEDDSEDSFARDTIIDQVKNVFLNVIPSTRKVLNVIDQLESGELRFKPSLSFENKMINQQSRNTKRIINSIFGTGLLISGTLILSEEQTIGIALMIFGSLTTLIQTRDKGERKRRRSPHFHSKMKS
jgi:predicted unusual protein kinase regulating ubiquinone biosynthesis (AarF/ABC1/UbiB family)